MTNQYSIRPIFLIGFLICLGMMGTALYAQYYLFMDPCPLCLFQRYAVTLLGIVFLIGGLHNPGSSFGRRLYGFLTIIGAMIGAAIAIRHVWIQHLPPEEVPACGPGVYYWLGAVQEKTMAISTLLNNVFQGTGECAEIHNFFFLSIPQWNLIVFALFALYGLKVLIKGR